MTTGYGTIYTSIYPGAPSGGGGTGAQAQAGVPPALNTYEYCFGDTGIILNSDAQGLPFVDVTDIVGLDSAPVRASTIEHMGMDGAYQDAQFMSMRTIAITGTVYDNALSPEIFLDQLRAQYAPGVFNPFYFKHPGSPLRFINAQGGGVKYDVDTNRRLGITPVVITLFCPDPYIYDYQPINPALTAQPIVLQVNANSDFETGVTPWQATGGATIVQSPNALTGISSLLVTPNGTTANPGAFSEYFAVIGGGKYTLQAEAFTSLAYATGVQVGINWYTSGLTFISSNFSSAVGTAATTWTPLSLNVTAPGTAAFGVMYIQAAGTPPSSTLFYWDDAVTGPAIGIGFPLGFNTGFGGPLVSLNNSTQVTHNGTHTAYPIFVLKGPLTNPVITNSQGQSIKINITMGSTDVLVVDCRYKQLILNGPIFTGPGGPIMTGPRKPPPQARGLSVRSAYLGLFWFSVAPGGADTYSIVHDLAAVTNGQMVVQLLGTYY